MDMIRASQPAMIPPPFPMPPHGFDRRNQVCLFDFVKFCGVQYILLRLNPVR